MSFLEVALDLALSPASWLMIFLGTLAGTVFGALPGISATMAVILVLPFTYGMGVLNALLVLVSTYCSAIYGGSITAILFNIPGTPSSAPTTFDGYPMTLKGQAGKALGTAIICSSLGGIFSVAAMATISPFIAELALRLNPMDYAAIAFLGLGAVVGLGAKVEEQLKGLLAVLLGLLLATVGMDPITGGDRFTFGSVKLLSGINMIPVMIGAFAGGEILSQIELRRGLKRAEELVFRGKLTAQMPSLLELLEVKWTIFKSALIGLFIGALPGAGATIAAFVSYGEAKRSSRHKDKFGTGILEGVAAPETANNASTGGAMIPLLTLGIPGSGTTAIILAVFVMYGLQPGPLLFSKNPELVHTIVWGMFWANLLMILAGTLVVRAFVQVLRFPYHVLATSIALLCIVGSFGVGNDLDQILIFAVFSLVGYVMKKLDVPVAAMVLGLVLGDIIESNFRRAVMMYGFSLKDAVGRPLTLSLYLLTVLVLLWPYISYLWRRARSAGRS